jgi:hypothetical protein
MQINKTYLINYMINKIKIIYSRKLLVLHGDWSFKNIDLEFASLHCEAMPHSLALVNLITELRFNG